jgi:hypothetical protein
MVEMSAPTYRDNGDGDEIGAVLSLGSGPDFYISRDFTEIKFD